MAWAPARRNPVERDFRIETYGDCLRVELLRGGRLYACRTLGRSAVREALALGERWLLIGPAIVVLERAPVAVTL